MVIFTICCLILIAIVWPRAFFGTLGALLVALILGIGVLLIESPDDKRETTRQAAPEATAALQKSQREAEERPKADDRARETQPALIVRRRTVIDTVGLANRRDDPRLPDVSF